MLRPEKAAEPGASNALFRQPQGAAWEAGGAVLTECLSVSPRLFALCDYSPRLLECSVSCLCDKDIHLPDMKILFAPIPNDWRWKRRDAGEVNGAGGRKRGREWRERGDSMEAHRGRGWMRE